MDRETEEPESDLCLASFQVDDVSFVNKNCYCREECPLSHLRLRAGSLGFLISCNRALDRNLDEITRKVHCHTAETWFDVEHYPGIATALDQMSIGGSRTRHGDEEVDTIFGVETT